MAEIACRKQDCTVAQTQRCLLNLDPASCPERRPVPQDPILAVPQSLDLAPLTPPKPRPRFEAGLTLGLEDATRLMSSRYVNMIGILGAPNAGKTAALVCLYLLLAKGKLDGFRYADSASIMTLDQLSRGARKWNAGALPDQVTGHTELGDSRDAGFLHLRLRRRDPGRQAYDLLLPDLPGEWTNQLIDRNSHERLSFLGRADAFWLVVDGRNLTNVETRNQTVHRTSRLLDRLGQFVGNPKSMPVFLVVTRRDSYDQLPKAAVDRITAAAANSDLSLSVAEVASFSVRDELRPGTGFPELIQRTLSAPSALSLQSPPVVPGTRQVLRYRS